MGYILLVFLAVPVAVYYGLHVKKIGPNSPRILVPLVLVSVLIVATAFLTKEPSWSEFLKWLNDWWTQWSTWTLWSWLQGFL